MCNINRNDTFSYTRFKQLISDISYAQKPNYSQNFNPNIHFEIIDSMLLENKLPIIGIYKSISKYKDDAFSSGAVIANQDGTIADGNLSINPYS